LANVGSTAIVKLGGSLLDLPDLSERLLRFIPHLDRRRILIITGGGAAADVIRRLDEGGAQTPHAAHWAAIGAMSYNAEVLVRLNQHVLRLARTRSAAEDIWSSGACAVLDSAAFLQHEPLADVVETSWNVTSDSLSAWIAHRWPAATLILAKSCDTTDHSITALREMGLVDQLLPDFALGLQVGWINLRSPDPALCWLNFDHIRA
jgi:aspartokinase-like uncharacterized kinase